jgi:hypothetical protein
MQKKKRMREYAVEGYCRNDGGLRRDRSEKEEGHGRKKIKRENVYEGKDVKICVYNVDTVHEFWGKFPWGRRMKIEMGRRCKKGIGGGCTYVDEG